MPMPPTHRIPSSHRTIPLKRCFFRMSFILSQLSHSLQSGSHPPMSASSILLFHSHMLCTPAGTLKIPASSLLLFYFHRTSTSAGTRSSDASNLWSSSTSSQYALQHAHRQVLQHFCGPLTPSNSLCSTRRNAARFSIVSAAIFPSPLCTSFCLLPPCGTCCTCF